MTEVARLRGEQVELRRTTAADGDALRSILARPEVGTWWGPVPDGFPMEDEPDATRWSILAGDGVAGLVQHGEETDPDYRHAWIDVFVDPQLHARGLGTDAVRTICRHLVDDLRHHRVTIDPAVENAPAIRCYEKAGFRRVGVMRAAWRNPSTSAWQDLLLMELVRMPADRP